MITQIHWPQELSALPEKGIEAQKIRALFLAYGTDYEFCRFYRQGSSFLSLLDNTAVLCDSEDIDLEEWAGFITMCGCRELFCSERAGIFFSKQCKAEYRNVFLMSFNGEPHNEPLDTEPALSDVYSIISDGFDIEFEPWYLDISHRVRHGISACRTLDGKAALVIQHDLNGEALISQVAVSRAHMGKGLASRLVKAAATELSPSTVYIICEERLVEFYKKCGFVLCGKKSILYL